ncbi:MAG TPA: holo-ACP synthase [Thermoplasmata archaeon]
MMTGFQTHGRQGIGVDIESVSRFGEIRSKEDKFLRTFLTHREIEYCFSKDNPSPHIAARFAGKEAVIKALSTLSVHDISFRDIEITNDGHGTPSAAITSRTELNIHIELSLSHSKENAIAFALAIRDGSNDR